MGLIGDVRVDLGHGLGGFGKVDVEGVSGVVVLDVLQEGLQGGEAGAQGHGVAHMQVVAALRHVEQMLVRLVDLSLLQGAVAQRGEHLLVGGPLGPGGQHGQGGGDAQRGEEDVLSGGGFGTQALVEGEGETMSRNGRLKVILVGTEKSSMMSGLPPSSDLVSSTSSITS
ncbi:hypothetical protein EYF80_009502 [Liparis tanakae]|uniref:Uncharacterized protein n=1 Tax=Liparis tanakae TaxID=230148 RepID=A0A4Z2IQX1_9TELE|nr:hypothetical protein EYF80_009502 [Liparis tanakae]